MWGEESAEETLSEARTRRDRALKATGKTSDGGVVTWYVTYLGKFGWKAYQPDGEVHDNPSKQDVRSLLDTARVDVIPRSELPEEAAI